MAGDFYLRVACATLFLLLATSPIPYASADLFRTNGELIPGTAGLVLRPSAQLDHRQLQGLDAKWASLRNATFESTDLSGAVFNLSTLTGANFTNAIVAHAQLRGIEEEQLYSTASYQQKQLPGVLLTEGIGWDLSGQNLAGAVLAGDFTDVNLIDANLDGAQISETLTGANLTNANIANARIYWNSLTSEQVYATASYQARDLRGVLFRQGGTFFAIPYDLTGWDFRKQDLTGSRLRYVDGTNADFSDATLFAADLSDALLHDTNSSNADLDQADLFSAEVVRTNLARASLVGADLRGAQLTDANFRGANLQNASFLLAAHLETASFSPETRFNQWTEFPEDFDPSVAGLSFVESPVGDFDANDALNADDIDLLTERIQLGDIADDFVVRDLTIETDGVRYIFEETHSRDIFVTKLRKTAGNDGWLDSMFDVTGDGIVDAVDLQTWLTTAGHENIGRPYRNGDANLDGLVNSQDLNIVGRNWRSDRDVAWTGGDFNGDGFVNATDLNLLGRNWGSGMQAAPVPEPKMPLLFAATLFILTLQFRKHSVSANGWIQNRSTSLR